MRHVSIGKAAMSVGTVFGAFHVLWVVLVGIGWAQPVLDFFLELHFIKLDYQLAPYSAVTGLALVAVTFSAGALLGAIFALVWNALSESEEQVAHRRDQSFPAH
jgi:hypothetical protein